MEVEENPSSTVLDGEIIGIRFGLATFQEICTASISDSAISHGSQLSNPFLGLPLEFGRCESCGTSEAGKCEGHFGYIELPVPIYHPSHVSELKRMLSLVCLNCLKMKRNKFPAASNGLAQRLLSSCCENASAPQVSIQEAKTTDGVCFLALRVSKSKLCDGFWNFLDKYGYHYGDGDHIRALLPFEVMEIIKSIPPDTRKKLSGKGYLPQEGYVLKYLPVPPNCLSVPEVSDGISVMSSDPSMTMLRKVLRKVEIIKGSRSGVPNFESHQVEANELQSIVDQYFQVRGTAKAARDIETKFGVNKELNESSTKAWLEKMRTLFIRKGSGFSSRSVITGDAYKRVDEIGLPLEVAQRITFEERVNIHNMSYLQELVDKDLCLIYKEGLSTYSLREGSKGHIYLKLGQIVHRRIMDGDIVFINRPPTTHKHSLQALAVYIHDDHTVKINPLICGPLGADFDGDCIHLFYPQSLAAKAEVLELFSVEKQLLSSHSGNLNLQLSTDSLLSLRMLFKKYFLDRGSSQQLAMFLSLPLPRPALLKTKSGGPHWTAVQILQCALPPCFDCTGDRYLTRGSEILEFDFNIDALPSIINEIAVSIFFGKGPEEAMRFFDVIQPFLMESLFIEGFSVALEDFFIPSSVIRNISRSIREISPLLYQLRSKYNELVEQQLEKYLHDVKLSVTNLILKSTRLGDLVDSKSESAIEKLVQQIGFLGLQLSDRGKFYTKALTEDVASMFRGKYCYNEDDYPSAEYGLLKGCFFHGLDPCEEIVHSISTREIIVRSSRGLSEPGTLFKNLMAILRDVVICYDGTVRNVCSNSIIQFEYGAKAGDRTQHLFPAGEPVGVLAATAMSNPAYKAVLDASPSSNSAWDLMKEILLCKVSFRNEPIDRRIILYLNDCGCGRKYCQENAAYLVKNQLRKVSLKDAAVEFSIEYKQQQTAVESFDTGAGLVGHIHLNEMILREMKINMAEVIQRCQETLKSFHRKKKVGHVFKKTEVFSSESCTFQLPSRPCVMFRWIGSSTELDKTANILADIICPVLLETIIKGDPRISSASIIWVNPDTNTWVRNPCRSPKGELALDVILEKAAVKQSGDAWRVVLDSCLPVLHLIDTRRSIPYAIKQVQELLGVSCAFDQAVQRLAASVKMVAKGVLREHLILLASSMTCGGNLVGFNTGGYKALSRQLNIQVPFTEATLFRPRKCFESAAEKCYTDSLSSVVASCSWGKHVAVGTGSRFEILWDAREVKSNEISGIDVYDFLHMVKGITNEEEKLDACLGEEVDFLEEDTEEWGMSPEHASDFDAIFEDNGALLNVQEDTSRSNNDWDVVASWQQKSSNVRGFEFGKCDGNSSLDPQAETSDWVEKVTVKKDINSSSGWGSTKFDDLTADDEPSQTEEINCSWGKPKSSKNKVWKETSDWDGKGIQKMKKSTSGWDSSKCGDRSSHDQPWGKPKIPEKQVWGETSRWDGKVDQIKENSASGWGSFKGGDNLTADDHTSQTWEHVKSPVDNSSWGKAKSPENQVWSSQNESNKPDEQPWGKPKIPENLVWGETSGWDGKVHEKKEKSSSGWGSFKGGDNLTADDHTSQTWEHVKSPVDNSYWGKAKSPENQVWNSQNESNKPDEQPWGKPKIPENQVWGEASGWGGKVHEKKEKSSSGWGSFKGGDNSTVDDHTSQTWEHVKSPVDNSSCGKASSPENQVWDSQNESNKTASSRGWNSQNPPDNSDSDRNSPWAKQNRESFMKNRFGGSQGWGSNRNRPTKSPGTANHETNLGLYTATKQRLDMFTSEEQNILSDIEPIMQSIRRIMQQSGYNDGDPLAADDQSFVLENVFEHHPDKETKMGAGIDHFMVSKHSSFQESRCFYIVSKDGRREDFSYRKCLDNFIKKKYPDLAEEFSGKYFRKPRPGGKREHNSTPINDNSTPIND